MSKENGWPEQKMEGEVVKSNLNPLYNGVQSYLSLFCEDTWVYSVRIENENVISREQKYHRAPSSAWRQLCRCCSSKWGRQFKAQSKNFFVLFLVIQKIQWKELLLI